MHQIFTTQCTLQRVILQEKKNNIFHYFDTTKSELHALGLGNSEGDIVIPFRRHILGLSNYLYFGLTRKIQVACIGRFIFIF